MTQHDLSLEAIGAAIHMWAEYGIAVGCRPLGIDDPAPWAARWDLTIRKVNFREKPFQLIAK